MSAEPGTSGAADRPPLTPGEATLVQRGAIGVEATVAEAARELHDALGRMAHREYLSLNVRHWRAVLHAALEREAAPPAEGKGA